MASWRDQYLQYKYYTYLCDMKAEIEVAVGGVAAQLALLILRLQAGFQRLIYLLAALEIRKIVSSRA